MPKKKPARRVVFTVTCFILMISLAGCTNSAPNCDDEETVSLLRKNFVDIQTENFTVDREESTQKMAGAEFQSIKQLALDEKPEGFTCEAIVDAPFIAGRRVQYPITYVTALDAEKKHYVSIKTVNGRDLAYDVMMSYKDSAKKEKEASPVLEEDDRGFDTPTDKKLDECINKKTVQFRKTEGEESLITAYIYDEWARQCKWEGIF